jgi:glutaconate CoA-transferase subunit B
MILTEMHPGVSLEIIRENLSWDIKVSDSIKTTRSPTARELKIIREDLDPDKIYLN